MIFIKLLYFYIFYTFYIVTIIKILYNNYYINYYIKMNNYIKICFCALILLYFSIINEIRDPLTNNLPLINYIHIYVIRYLHYVIYLMTTFYLIFFNGIGTKNDAYIFLTLIMGIVFGWYIFDCCWSSYLELLFYNIDVNLKNIKNTFHPLFHNIFGNYDRFFIAISGLLYILNVTIVLYYLTSVKLIYKILYFIIFLFLFTHENKSKYYSTKNKNLLLLQNIYDKYVSLLQI